MRHSLLFRFLGLSLAVALGAVIATAVLATYSTSEQLQGELDGTANQLQEDGAIHAELTKFATEHREWSGVDRLVRSLADETGRRIALTRVDGSIIVDSARVLGAGPDLPSVPAATIDPRYPVTKVAQVSAVSEAGVAAKLTTGGAVFSSEYWGLTDAERRERERLAEAAVSCYRAQGVNASVVQTPGGASQLVIQSDGKLDGTTVPEYTKTLPSMDDRCRPKGLDAPSARALAVNEDELRRATACLDAAGLAYELTNDPGGLRAVTPPDKRTAVQPAFANCVTTAHSQAVDPYVAPAARLYLGGESQFNVFSGDGLLRTAATALGVLLIAAVVTVLAGRRLVRPILALTGAARRMTNGDHAARVPVSGRDEVARLGHAFNAMAESIQQHDSQRKAMVSDVAHELRTPLANIKGYLVASQDGVVPLDRALVASLLEEAGLLEHLVVDLQDLALADAGMLRLHPSPRDLAELAQQVVAAHRPAAERAGVTLTAEVAGPIVGTVVATVDGARIRQALGNLVSNAIRFTPSSGRVTVAVCRTADGYDLTVADTGTGIAAEHLPKVFDRFYRAEGSRSRTTGGSGLGLAITKHLVEAHHGTITVNSTRGAGSTFTIHLPAAAR